MERPALDAPERQIVQSLATEFRFSTMSTRTLNVCLSFLRVQETNLAILYLRKVRIKASITIACVCFLKKVHALRAPEERATWRVRRRLMKHELAEKINLSPQGRQA